MPWVKLDDGFYDHPKFAKAGPLGLALWTVGLAWSARNLTDGFIPTARASTLLDFAGIGFIWGGELVGAGEDVETPMVIRDLVSAGLWEEVPGGYQIHDFLDWQPSSHDVRKERQRVLKLRRAAGSKGGQAKGKQTNKQNGSKPTANVQANSQQSGEQNNSPDPDPEVTTSSSSVSDLQGTYPQGDDDDLEAEIERRYQASLAAGTAIPRPKAWKAKVRKNLIAEVAREGRGVLTPPKAKPPDPTEATSAAQRVRAERNEARKRGEACSGCEGTGWSLGDDGVATQCRACGPGRLTVVGE